MIDHTDFHVSDYNRSKRFYQTALAPLGYSLMMEWEGEAAGFGAEGSADFWLEPGGGEEPHLHIAFRAQSRRAVDEFYKAAMGAGAKDNGKPGIRSDYHPNYYAAYVLDPDGNNIEAVCHTPQ